ncbi:MAG: NAD(P)H-hydrate epimerase [Candidatus Omnitrophota bacterium]
MKEVIMEINNKKLRVVSVDIPSGLSAQTGDTRGASIKASMTVTFTFPKTGMYLSQGPEHCGKIVAADIGIPQRIIKEVI